jgi:hypothetical protein
VRGAKALDQAPSLSKNVLDCARRVYGDFREIVRRTEGVRFTDERARELEPVAEIKVAWDQAASRIHRNRPTTAREHRRYAARVPR